jgi:AraC-like DNA-binding protein
MAGYNLSDIASIANVYPSHVSRVVRKQTKSARIWAVIADVLNGGNEVPDDVQEKIPA